MFRDLLKLNEKKKGDKHVEKDEGWGTLPQTQHQQEVSKAQNLPLSAERTGDPQIQSGLGNGYYLHPNGQRGCEACSHNGGYNRQVLSWRLSNIMGIICL